MRDLLAAGASLPQSKVSATKLWTNHQDIFRKKMGSLAMQAIFAQ